MSVIFINWLLNRECKLIDMIVGACFAYFLIHIDIWIIRSIIDYIRGY